MMTIIKIESLVDIKLFAELCAKQDTEIIVRKGKFSVDGASILGLMSINPTDAVAIEYDENVSSDLIEFVEKHKA